MPEGELREGRDDLPLGPLPGRSLLEDFLGLLKLPFLGRGQADRCHLHTRIHGTVCQLSPPFLSLAGSSARFGSDP